MTNTIQSVECITLQRKTDVYQKKKLQYFLYMRKSVQGHEGEDTSNSNTSYKEFPKTKHEHHSQCSKLVASTHMFCLPLFAGDNIKQMFGQFGTETRRLFRGRRSQQLVTVPWQPTLAIVSNRYLSFLFLLLTSFFLSFSPHRACRSRILVGDGKSTFGSLILLIGNGDLVKNSANLQSILQLLQVLSNRREESYHILC